MKVVKTVNRLNAVEQVINLEAKAIDGIMGKIIDINGPFYENENKDELAEI